MKKTFSNPFRLMTTWVVGSSLFTIIIYFALGFTRTGGEQLPFTFLALMIPIIVYVTLALSVLSIPIYFTWFKQKWWINLLFMLPGFWFLYLDIFLNNNASNYLTTIATITINNKMYEKKTEFYDLNGTKIKSVSFMFNNKKDSIWTEYNLDGQISSQQVYKDGKLIKTVK